MIGLVIMAIVIGVFCYGYYRHKEYKRLQVKDEDDRLRMIRRRDLEKTLIEGTSAEQEAAKEGLDELDKLEPSKLKP